MFVGIPLAARHARVGVLAVFSRRPRRPSPGTLDALGVLAAQAALAVESVRLFADSERRRRSAEALASVSQALAHSLDPRQVAHLIADNVIALLRARDVTLYRVQPRTGDLVSVAFAGEGAAGFASARDAARCRRLRARGGDAPRGLHPRRAQRSGRRPHAGAAGRDQRRPAIVRWSQSPCW